MANVRAKILIRDHRSHYIFSQKSVALDIRYPYTCGWIYVENLVNDDDQLQEE